MRIFVRYLVDPGFGEEKFESGINILDPQHTGRKFFFFLYFRSSAAQSPLPRRPYEGQLYPGEYPYKCSYCEKKFKQVGHVHQHERTHLGTQKYTCEHCDKKFNQLSHIRQLVLCSRICSCVSWIRIQNNHLSSPPFLNRSQIQKNPI